MRVDKYLWCVRKFKTRTIATDYGKKNKIMVNQAIVKPSKEIGVGDIIGLRKNQIDYLFKVLDIPKSRLGAKLVSMYLEDKTDKQQIERLKEIQNTQNYYRAKGEGRPTKKDRRSIDDFFEDDFLDD